MCILFLHILLTPSALIFVNTTLFASVREPPPSCPHMHLLFGLEAQMYIHLILVPAVKLQRGLKDPPHSPLRKGLQETHTHTHIHTYTMAGQRPCRKRHRGIPARPGRIIFPLTSCSSVLPPVFPRLSSALLAPVSVFSHLPPEAIALTCEEFKKTCYMKLN